MGRATQGVRFIRLDEGDKLVSLARVIKEDDGETGAIQRAQVPPPEENGSGPASDVVTPPPAPPTQG